MPNPNPNQSGLIKPFAPDITEKTVPKTIRIEPSYLQWLNTLDGGFQYNVRQAIREYKEKIVRTIA